MPSSMQWNKLGQTLGDGEGQGGLACYSLWGCKELDTTEQLTLSLSYIFVCVCVCVCIHINDYINKYI